MCIQEKVGNRLDEDSNNDGRQLATQSKALHAKRIMTDRACLVAWIRAVGPIKAALKLPF